MTISWGLKIAGDLVGTSICVCYPPKLHFLIVKASRQASLEALGLRGQVLCGMALYGVQSGL